MSLKYICDVRDGTHDTPQYVYESDNSYPLVTSKDISNGNINFESAKFISEEDYLNISKRSNVNFGDLLMPMIGTVGGSVLVETYRKFTIKNVALFKAGQFCAKWLKYFLDSELSKIQFELEKNGGVQDFVGLTTLRNLIILKLPLKEQTAIAHYLDTKLGEIDALIDKQQTLLEKLAEQRTAVITQAVTKGLNPAATMKNSGIEWLGDVPVHWDIERLKFIASVNKGKMPKELVSENFDDFPTYLSMDYLRNGIATHFVVDRTVPVIDENEILLLWDGANAGEFIKSKKGVISSTIALIKFQDRIYKNFAWYACLVIERILRASTIGMGIPHVNGEELKNSPIVLPPVKEQMAIAEYLDQETAKIDRLCETVNQTIGRLKEYRTALITQAVTGKIKVTN